MIQTLDVFEQTDSIDGIVLACKAEWIDHTKTSSKRLVYKNCIHCSRWRQCLDSHNGLAEAKRLFPNEEVTVLIHDGVRPLVDKATIERNIESVETKGSAITVTPAIETVMFTDNGSINRILNRSECLMAKAPQSFILDDILSVHDRAKAEGIHDFIDSASMMMHYGYTLYPVLGKTENIKITTPSDYYMFTGIIKNRELGGLQDE
ncbi:MAG: 2-C-methyl-D-erythritol 4-phosphate cytidylyltransferase [Veillonella sp.]